MVREDIDLEGEDVWFAANAAVGEPGIAFVH